MELPIPSERQVVGFAALYEREFSKELTRAEATDVAARFLQLYWLLTRPKSQLENGEYVLRRVKRRWRRAKSQAMKRSTKLIAH